MTKSDKELLEALRQLPTRDLLNLMAAAGPTTPNQTRVDMSKWLDHQILETLNLETLGDPNNIYVDSALEELTKRANAQCVTVADYKGMARRACAGAGRTLGMDGRDEQRRRGPGAPACALRRDARVGAVCQRAR